MNAKARAAIRLQRSEELRGLMAKNPDIEVWEFSPSHLRIVGKIRVDYWPGTGRAWVTYSAEPSFESLEPYDVIALAMERLYATHP
jgi:hypothetical protein